jgi:hypothetical protein
MGISLCTGGNASVLKDLFKKRIVVYACGFVHVQLKCLWQWWVKVVDKVSGFIPFFHRRIFLGEEGWKKNGNSLGNPQEITRGKEWIARR